MRKFREKLIVSTINYTTYRLYFPKVCKILDKCKLDGLEVVKDDKDNLPTKTNLNIFQSP